MKNKEGFWAKDVLKLIPGTPFEGIFVIEATDIKRHKTGEPFLRVVLSDKTGGFTALWWKPPKDEDLTKYKKGDVVFVKGTFELHQGKPQPRLTVFKKLKEGEYPPEKFLNFSSYPIEDMVKKVYEIIETIENPFLKTLLEKIFKNKEILEKIKITPAGKKVHHTSIGGLLEHTLGIVEICEVVVKRYKKLNRDLLITAALLHDIGKIFEYKLTNTFDITDEGRLLGHVYLGTEFVSKIIDSIEGFPKNLKLKLLHCILSHQGEYEFGSPKRPKMLEAAALHLADSLDAKLKAFEEFIDKEMEEGSTWTKIHPAYMVPIYYNEED